MNFIKGPSVAIAYLYPCDARETFVPFAKRWAESYKKFAPSMAHDVIVSMSNGDPGKEDFSVFSGIKALFDVGYNGGGWDIGNFQHIAKYHDYDLIVFMNSRAHFCREGWLDPFIKAFDKFGPNGLYGVMASFESCPIPNTFHAPNPHIRTSCLVTSPKILRQFPHVVDSREQSFKFESGEWNVSNWYLKNGWPVKLVTSDGFYDREDWRKPLNIFRRGDQSNCLIADRHTLLYEAAGPEEKKRLAASADDGMLSPLAKIRRTKTVTIVAATSLNAAGHAKAIDWTAGLVPMPCKKLLISPETVAGFSGKHVSLPEPWAKNGEWSLDDMQDFILYGLHEYIDTEVAIIVHDDGYALNRSKWMDEFLEYDYIGAPWPIKFPWVKPGYRVGNGGFSLRSHKWLKRASTLPMRPPGFSEDGFVNIMNRDHFISGGCSIAPLDVAMRWSFEHTIEEYPNWKLSDSFGFHGRKNEITRKHLVL